VRTRLSLAYKRFHGFIFSGMLQDPRSPWYGESAPSSVRDPIDLHESYFEFRPGSKPVRYAGSAA